MNVIETIALVIIVAALLVMIMSWAYDWGFKSSRNENELLKRENKSLIIRNNLSQENSQRIQNSYSKLIDEMRKMDVENDRLKKQEVYNNYNLDNTFMSLNIENKKLKDQGSKDKIRIKELESACDRKNERIIELEQSHKRKDERIKNLEEVVLDLRICVRALKKQILDEKLSSEEFNTLKKEG